MKDNMIVGSKFAFLQGVIAGITKEEYDDYERPVREGDLGRVVRYELVVVLYENRQHINYDSEAERDADYEIVLQAL